MLRAELLDRFLLEVGVQLDLVDRGHDRRLLEKGGEVLDHEVADADGAHLAVREERLQRPVRLERLVECRGEGLVQDEQVDLLDAQLAGALVEAVQGLVVAVVADPDLRLDDDVVAGHTGAADGVADLALVAVGGGSVDVAVARLQRSRDGGTGLLRRCLEDPQPDGGHLDLVVQLQSGHVTDRRRGALREGGAGVTPLVALVRGFPLRALPVTGNARPSSGAGRHRTVEAWTTGPKCATS